MRVEPIFVGVCLLLLACSLWLTGGILSTVEGNFEGNLKGAQEACQRAQKENLATATVFNERLKASEGAVADMEEAHVAERAKLSDEEFWDASGARDRKIRRCRDEGHHAIPTRRGWGIICIRKEAIIWSD